MRAPEKSRRPHHPLGSRFWRPLATVCAVTLAFVTVSCATAATAGLGVKSAPTAVSATATPAPTATATPVPAPTPTATPSVDLEKVKPNEAGTIPILEFHRIVDGEEDQWTITPDHFRRALQKLYEAGYRPIALNDLLDGRIDLPAGTSPVVLTLDDSSPGQFRFLEKDGRVEVDPDSAVGILEAFHAAHPDFEARATFFVLPQAAQPHKLFGQPQYEAQKLRYLAERGFEIGNHSYWHQRLDDVDDQEVQRQLALAVKEIQQAVPGYNVRSMALPLGMWPKNRALALEGSFQGASYKNDAILLVAANPAPSPFHVDFDPHALERVQVFADRLERWLAYLEKHPDEHYVSDGDPGTITLPKHLESQLSPTAVGGRKVRAY